MNRLLEDAAHMLEVATNATRLGQPVQDTAVLIGDDGSIRVIVNSDWPTDGLQRQHGTATAYRITNSDGLIRVTGRDRTQRCQLETDTPDRIVRRLFGPSRRQLALSAAE